MRVEAGSSEWSEHVITTTGLLWETIWRSSPASLSRRGSASLRCQSRYWSSRAIVSALEITATRYGRPSVERPASNTLTRLDALRPRESRSVSDSQLTSR